MQKSYQVAVLFGGVSCENEVSVITGTMVCNVLKKGGTTALPVYICHDGTAYAGEELGDVTAFKSGKYRRSERCAVACGGVIMLKKSGKPYKLVKAECIINCCHGGVYEGGAVAGVAAVAKIPLASADIFESAVFMDKYYTKLALKALGVKTARYAFIRSEREGAAAAEEVGYPVLVKPVRLGSSIGIKKADDALQLEKALALAFSLDEGVLIEEYISPMREVNCAAYFAEGKAVISPLEEVVSSGELLSYDDKYSGGGRRIFPAEIDGEIERAVRATTQRVYTALGMRGIVRFDYIIKEDNGGGAEVYLSEVNTVPGSLSQYLVSSSYKDFYGVLTSVIRQAEEDYARRSSKRIIKTGILNNINKNTCKLK